MRTRLGQAIIEVMIAIAVAIVALLALVQLSNKSVNTTGVAARVTDAQDIAGQAMELVRSEREENGWAAFRTTHTSGVGCFDGTALAGTASCTVAGTEFTSQMTYVFSAPGVTEQATVTVIVSWVDNAINKTATLQTVLTKY